MEYKDLKAIFRKHEQSYPKHHLTAHISFSSFGPNADMYEGLSKVYELSSDNKAFQPNKGGYSIFASCLDGKDPCVRLEQYMAEERGDVDGWVVEDCWIIGWLVSTFHVWRDYPKELKAQKLHCSHTEAVDAMMRMLCEKGGLNYEAMKQKYNIQQGRIRDNDCWLDSNHAHLYDDTPDDWSWDIRVVRIYSPTNIVFEDPATIYEKEEVHSI